MRCPTCGAPALTDDAVFCVGCGGELVADADRPLVEEARSEDTILPTAERRVARRAVREKAPVTLDAFQRADPTVPLPVVIAGAVVLLVILLVLLLSA